MKGPLFAAALLAACTAKGPEPAAPKAQPSAAAPKSQPSAAPAKATEPAADPNGLPAADRVFFAGGLVLGADGTSLWAREPGPGKAERWRIEGSGVVHQVVAGDLGDGPRLYVTRGVGRGHLDAPLVLQAVDPATGAASELWRNSGERNEPTTLAVADVDRDGRAELAFAHYASKYMVRTRHLEAGGRARTEGPEIRMATTRLWADVNGDGAADEVLGRVYGDAKDVPGDLRVDRGRGLEPIPTENGVKSAIYASVGGTAPALYFCDGWVANYGKEARARLKRARFEKGRWRVEQVGASADEFTFFSLGAADVDGDGKDELVAQGDKRITVFFASPDGALRAEPRGALEPVLNTAVGRDEAGRPVVYVPARPNTRVLALR